MVKNQKFFACCDYRTAIIFQKLHDKIGINFLFFATIFCSEYSKMLFFESAVLLIGCEPVTWPMAPVMYVPVILHGPVGMDSQARRQGGARLAAAPPRLWG